jgi:regulator of protease activity HflC (stomatin/prohibitin superfamily)
MNEQHDNPQHGGDQPGDIEDQLGLGGGARSEMEVEAPRRSASLTLATDETREARAASMEAAHRSLAEALGITYRLLQLLIVALIVLFLFSGLTPVGETQRAVKTRFGQVVNDDIQPGFVFSLPYPIGDVRTAPGDERSLNIDDAFFPFLREGERDQAVPEMRGNDALNPVRDGSLITADGNLAIVRMRVSYRIDDASAFLRNLGAAADEDAEQAETFVRAAVQAAAVRVGSEATIDSLVGQSVAGLTDATDEADAVAIAQAAAEDDGAGAPPAPVGEQEIQRRIQRLAQDRLDALDSGIVITTIVLRDAFPPRNVLQRFERALDAISESRISVEAARREAQGQLVGAVGSDYEAVRDLLDLYESAVEADDDQRSDELLRVIFDVLEGAYADEPLVLDGRDFGRITVSGRVSETLGEARAYRDSIPALAREQARAFRGALERFDENPAAYIARTWADGMRRLLEDENKLTTVFTFPDLAEGFRLRLNNDPEVAEDIERQINRQRRDAAEREREELLGIN